MPFAERNEVEDVGGLGGLWRGRLAGVSAGLDRRDRSPGQWAGLCWVWVGDRVTGSVWVFGLLGF